MAQKKLAEKLDAIKTKAKKKPSAPNKNTVQQNRLKLLVTIVGRQKAEYYIDLIQSLDVNMQCVLVARGTANQSTLELLGLSDSDKVVILSVIQENKVSEVIPVLEDKFNSIKGGKGVAWTISLTSVIGKLIYGFLSNNRETVKENKQ